LWTAGHRHAQTRDAPLPPPRNPLGLLTARDCSGSGESADGRFHSARRHRARRAIARSDHGARPSRSSCSAGDASSRRYVRVRVDGGGPSTAGRMVLAEGRFAAATSSAPRWRQLRAAVRHHGALPLGAWAPRSRPCTATPAGSTDCWCSRTSATRRSGQRRRASPRGTRAVRRRGGHAGARCSRPARATADPACPAFGRRFDAALAAAEVEHFVDHGIETRHGIPSGTGRACRHSARPSLRACGRSRAVRPISRTGTTWRGISTATAGHS
jgi:hypothetical protein